MALLSLVSALLSLGIYQRLQRSRISLPPLGDRRAPVISFELVNPGPGRTQGVGQFLGPNIVANPPQAQFLQGHKTHLLSSAGCPAEIEMPPVWRAVLQFCPVSSL